MNELKGGKDEPHRWAPLVAKGGGHDEVVPLAGPLLEDGRTIRGDVGRGVGDVARGTGPFTPPPDGLFHNSTHNSNDKKSHGVIFARWESISALAPRTVDAHDGPSAGRNNGPSSSPRTPIQAARNF